MNKFQKTTFWQKFIDFFVEIAINKKIVSFSNQYGKIKQNLFYFIVVQICDGIQGFIFFILKSSIRFTNS